MATKQQSCRIEGESEKDTGISQQTARVAPAVFRDQEQHPDVAVILNIEGSHAGTDSEPHYSAFTVRQKQTIVLSASFIGLLSYMSGSIYYPALNKIGRDLHVSGTKINLTVTVYLITQGIAPVIIADFSETAGRRPAYLIAFLIAIVANLGLALQNEYYALLFLRMLQSAGSCGTLSQGLIGDCIVSAERGKYVAYASVDTVLGPSLSPILGGLISQYAGWRWIFWFLLLLSVATVLPLALFLPETCRKVVGDGSIPPPRLCSNISDSIRFKNRLKRGIPVDREKQAQLQESYHFTLPNPMATLRILGDLESALLLASLSLAYACYYITLTDISKALYEFYNFSNIKISLAALSIAGGSLTSSFTTGRLLDWNYRRHAKRLGFTVSRDHQTDLTDFPIERVRLEIGLPMMFLGAIGVVAYGWTLNSEIPVAVPITFLCFVGYGIGSASQVLFILMADIHPGKFAVAAAARNICQCLVGAAASATIEPMILVLGRGVSYTIFASLFMLGLGGLGTTMKKGMKWRREKRDNMVGRGVEL